jgi:hypothetical protein
MENRDELTATLTQTRAVVDLLRAGAVNDEGHAITPGLLIDSLWTVTDLLDRAQGMVAE